MKWDNICPICLKEFSLNDEIDCQEDTLYHSSCLVNKEKIEEDKIKQSLKEVILNFDDIDNFTEFDIDLEELCAYTQDITNYKYFIIFRGEYGGFACLYTNNDNFEEVQSFLQEQDACAHHLYVVGVIQNRKFVDFEEVPRTIKLSNCTVTIQEVIDLLVDSNDLLETLIHNLNLKELTGLRMCYENNEALIKKYKGEIE